MTFLGQRFLEVCQTAPPNVTEVCHGEAIDSLASVNIWTKCDKMISLFAYNIYQLHYIIGDIFHSSVLCTIPASGCFWDNSHVYV